MPPANVSSARRLSCSLHSTREAGPVDEGALLNFLQVLETPGSRC